MQNHFVVAASKNPSPKAILHGFLSVTVKVSELLLNCNNLFTNIGFLIDKVFFYIIIRIRLILKIVKGVL